MPRFPVAFAVFALLAATLVTAFNQTLELENSGCDNGCFFNSFPGGSCSDDAACMCTRKEYREAYFCCMKDCNPNVMPESITRQHRECKARNMDFTFDAEAVCGVKLTTSAGYVLPAPTTSATTAADSTTTGDSKSSTASASTTSAASSVVTQETSSAGSQTASSGSTPTPTNGASGRGAILDAVMIMVAVSAVVLC